jgi:hypothetical protein
MDYESMYVLDITYISDTKNLLVSVVLMFWVKYAT